MNEKQHVFIIGSKGIPAMYGGFETFIEKLTQYRKDNQIQYHVSCLSDNKNEFQYNNAHCFNIPVPNIGAAKAVYYDLAALRYCCGYIRTNMIQHAVVYLLACRIGPFVHRYKKQLQQLGSHLFVNPDGHEWKRGKWNPIIKKYWKLSEKLLVQHSELMICDSRNIEEYIKEDYKQRNPRTVFISYGADTSKSTLSDSSLKLTNWYKENNISPKGYYLVVGRFVPENNYETMIKEFIRSKTKKDLVIITGVNDNAFYKKLKSETDFDKNSKVKFVGAIYDQDLLKKIRENAYGYIHGHEVGGTNPSLLEALASTNLNLLLDVGFNREVGEDGALYWNKEPQNLAGLISKADMMPIKEVEQLSVKAKKRISSYYNWDNIVNCYENVFSNVINM